MGVVDKEKERAWRRSRVVRNVPPINTDEYHERRESTSAETPPTHQRSNTGGSNVLTNTENAIILDQSNQVGVSPMQKTSPSILPQKFSEIAAPSYDANNLRFLQTNRPVGASWKAGPYPEASKAGDISLAFTMANQSQPSSQENNDASHELRLQQMSPSKIRRTSSVQLTAPPNNNLYGMEPLQPGFEFVPWGEYGPPDRTQQQSSRTIDDPESVSGRAAHDDQPSQNTAVQDAVVEGELIGFPTEKRFMRKRCILLAGGLLLVLAGCGVAVGIGVFGRKSSAKEVQPATTPMDPPTVLCDTWFKRKQPSVITQCLCIGKITIVADDVEANYNKLKSNGFIQAIHPGFDSPMDSCDPANQALLWLASATGTPSPQANLRQRYILALLFSAWDGQVWTVKDGWLSSDTECTWKGVTCERTGEASEINLYNNELSGHLGSDYSKLTGLKALSLGQNFLAGTLPSELSLLTALTSLIMETNQVTGSLPNELGLLTLLQELKLGENRLSGTIPTWIGQLIELQTLELYNNTLTSTQTKTDKESEGNYSSHLRQHAFPTEMGLLTNLIHLRLDSNELRGTLPTELFKIGSSLIDLVINNNALSGMIPNLVGNLGNLGLAMFSYNAFTGTIPPEFVQCTRLTYFYLNNNHLRGTVPSSLGLLTKLLTLDLDGNDLSGSIPTSICTLVSPILCPTTSNVTCSCCACN